MDTTLETLIRQSIPEGIGPLPSQLLHRLDKSVYSASSKLYADVLKKQFSLGSHATTTNADNNRPPRKRQAAIIDYDSDQFSEITTSTTTGTTTDGNHNIKQTHMEPKTIHDCTELSEIKKELAELHIMLTNAVDQFKSAIATLTTTIR